MSPKSLLVGLSAALALISVAVPARAALKLQEFSHQIEGAPVEAFAVTDDGKDSAVAWVALLPGSLPSSGLSVPELASRTGARVAVNGNFYREDTPGFQEPIGLVVHEGRIVALPVRFYPSAGLLAGKLEWDNVRLEASVEVESRGKRLRRSLCRLNARATGDCVSLWMHPPADAQGLLFLGKEFRGLATGSHIYELSTEKPSAGKVALPALQWPGPRPPGLSSRVTIEVSLTGERLGSRWQGVKEAVSGSHVLSAEKVFPAATRSWATSRQPRTLIGADERGRPWVAVFDGRRPESRGVSVLDAWHFMHEKLHAAWALNLDGGGSTTMIFEGRLVNKPSDGFPRNVAVGFGAIAR